MPRASSPPWSGPSGCGKTTTLKMINRLIEPTSGHHRGRRQRRAATRPVHELRRGIGYVIQQVGLFPHRTVADQHRHRAPPARLGQASASQDRVAELVDLVGLDRAPPRPLPGGAVRRPAAAGRRGPGPRRRPAGAADGRALQRRRPHRPGPPPGRAARASRSRCTRPSCSSPTTSTRPSSWPTGSPSSTSAGCSSSTARPRSCCGARPTSSSSASSAASGGSSAWPCSRSADVPLSPAAVVAGRRHAGGGQGGHGPLRRRLGRGARRRPAARLGGGRRPRRASAHGGRRPGRALLGPGSRPETRAAGGARHHRHVPHPGRGGARRRRRYLGMLVPRPDRRGGRSERAAACLAAADADSFLWWDWVDDHYDEIWDRTVEHLQLTGIAAGHRLRGRPWPCRSSPCGSAAPTRRSPGSPAALHHPEPGALRLPRCPSPGSGRTTAEIGLVSYTLLILVRNIVAGVDGVPAAVKEAADGMGYTRVAPVRRRRPPPGHAGDRRRAADRHRHHRRPRHHHRADRGRRLRGPHQRRPEPQLQHPHRRGGHAVRRHGDRLRPRAPGGRAAAHAVGPAGRADVGARASWWTT